MPREILKILKIEPNTEPYIKEIVGDLAVIQSEVGGYIEAVCMPDGALLICNEDGKILDLTPNRRVGYDVIMGNFFLVGQKGEEFASLTLEQIETYEKIFSL